MKRDLAVLTLAMTFPALMAWIYFVVLAVEGAEANAGLQLAFAAGKLVQFGLPVVYVWWFNRERLRPRAPSTRGLMLGIAFGLAAAAGLFLLYFAWLKHTSLLADAPARIYRKVQEFGMATPAKFIILAAFITVIHSFLEEYYWRWFVFAELRKYLSLPGAAVLSGLAFMAHHVIVLAVYFPGEVWTLAVPLSLCVAVGGGVWAWIYERSRSILGPWLSHIIIDAAIMTVGYDLIARFWTAGPSP